MLSSHYTEQNPPRQASDFAQKPEKAFAKDHHRKAQSPSRDDL
jgi:hypothetical protein